jgi:hypothetical protein
MYLVSDGDVIGMSTAESKQKDQQQPLLWPWRPQEYYHPQSESQGVATGGAVSGLIFAFCLLQHGLSKNKQRILSYIMIAGVADICM